MEKRIEVLELPVKDIKHGFGNPRKVTASKKKELRESMERHGNWGLIVIDERNNVISGNQRVAILQEDSPDELVLCKRLIGYSKSELRAINIKANQHAGEWDIDMLADWTADLNADLSLDNIIEEKGPEGAGTEMMELIHYEKYDYVMIVCRYQTDYNELLRRLQLTDKKVPITNKRSIRCRAVWYDKMNATIVPNEELTGDANG